MRNIIVTFFVFACCNGFSQQSNIISEKEFEKLREKTEEMATFKPDSALVFANQLIRYSTLMNSEKYLAKALSTLAYTKIWQSKIDQAILLNQKSYKINLKINNQIEIAKNLTQFGTIYQNKSDYVKATNFFLMSIELCEKVKLYSLNQKNYRSLSNISNQNSNPEKGLEYVLKAIQIEKSSPNEIDRADNFARLAVCYSILEKFSLSQKYYNVAYELYKKKNHKFRMAVVLAESSLIYEETNPVKSVELELQAKKILDIIAPEHLLSAMNTGNIGESYFEFAKTESFNSKFKNSGIPQTKTQLLTQSEIYIKESIELSKNANSSINIRWLTKVLSDLQAYNGDYKNAYKNLLINNKLNDSLFSQKNKNAIAKLESEKEVLELKTANEKKSTLNKILIGSSIGLLLIGFFGFRNFRNKRKLQNLKISELEKDKQLFAIDSMLKGQEEERSRIAKDLHDGLGGLLSGTKLSFTNMKENLLLTPENAILFEKSIGMLDTTIADLRKVAHNLMPEALVKFGLNDALNDFCSSIQLASNIKVDYQKIGLDRKIGNTAETFIYRIIQELVNNAVKHAEAKEILVQVAYTNNKIIVTVEDNGKGYDKNLASTGDGLDNIAYRVKYLSGTIDTVTSLNNGTSVNIELNA